VFNASQVRVYVRPVGGGTIKYFDVNVLVGAPQTFTVGLTGTGTVGTIPVDPANSFGLYRAEDGSYAIAPVIATSDFSSDNYEVAIAYVFNDRVTSIDHSTNSGNIYEASGTLAELYQAADYWKYTVANAAALRALSSSGYPNFHRRAIADIGLEVVWNALSYETDDGLNFFKPSDRDTLQPGRYEAIVAQLNKNQTYRAAQAVKVNAIAYATTLTLDLRQGNFKVNLTGDTEISFSNELSGGSWIVHLIQDATGGRLVDFVGIDWGAIGSPIFDTAPNKRNIVTIVCDDTDLFGFWNTGFGG
jgi:hypothetical protein